ncbi:nitroreductase/quinone reductase family protein [Streptomyces sp. NPDC051322]|uniref:nitroreductase/quinone reductase family protein n=1 Tax=Streptomyces sp. NPDC051322 TaxID=3154645 RepID=UPI003450EBC7
MAKTYRVGAMNRLVNAVFSAMTRRGLGRADRHVLTVRGRRSGIDRSVPVDVMSCADGGRFVVAAYKVGGWVHNVREAGEVTLSRGGRTERLRAVELPPEQCVPVLRQYLREVPVTRPYFDITADSPDSAVIAESVRHPVFRLEALPAPATP